MLQLRDRAAFSGTGLAGNDTLLLNQTFALPAFYSYRTQSGVMPGIVADFLGGSYGMSSQLYGALQTKTLADIFTTSRASTATYFDANGVMQTAAVDTPRFDYDPVTKAVRGLLIEGGATNKLTYSADFTNAAWDTYSGSVTVTAGATTAPDGTVSASKIIPSTASGIHLIRQTGATTNNQTVSVYAQAAGYGWLVMSAYTGSAYFDLTNGVVGTVTSPVTGAKITPVGGGIYRCEMNCGAQSSTGINFYVSNSGTGVSYAGDGTSGVYLWGAQMEATNSATSYIPTTSAAVTRAADICYHTFGAEWAPTAGTLVAEYQAPAVDQLAILAYANTSGYGNSFGLTHGNSSNTVPGPDINGSVFNVAESRISLSSTASDGAVHKAAIGYDASRISGAADGGAVISAANSQQPAPTKLHLGQRDGGNLPFNGHLRKVLYYPVRLSDADMQRVAT